MNEQSRKRLLVHILFVPSLAIMVLPVLWMVVLSFRPLELILTGLRSIASGEFTLDNYQTIFANYNVPRFLFNSIVASVIPALVSTLAALLAGYALVRFRFRGHRFFLSLPLFAQIIPPLQLLVPFYALMLITDLLDTYLAVILAHTSMVLPFAVWTMTGYLKGLSADAEEAAMVDGCSRIGAIFRIVLPIVRPGIAATFLIAFLTAWAEFLYAFILTSSKDMMLLSVALYYFVPGGTQPALWGHLFAMATILMAPSLLLFTVLQMSFKKGLALGMT